MSETKKGLPSVPWEKWNTLSEVEISMLKAVGVELLPEKVPGIASKPKVAQTFKIDPYVLRVTINCRLCGTSHVECFHLDNVDSKYSISNKSRINETDLLEGEYKDLTIKSTKRVVQICPYCSGKLLELPGEELVDKILTLTRELHGVIGVTPPPVRPATSPLNCFRTVEEVVVRVVVEKDGGDS